MLGRASWRRGRPKDELNGVLRKGDLGGGKEVRRPGEKKKRSVVFQRQERKFGAASPWIAKCNLVRLRRGPGSCKRFQPQSESTRVAQSVK